MGALHCQSESLSGELREDPGANELERSLSESEGHGPAGNHLEANERTKE